ncbi:MAG: rRNA maturation RNase YbeY [Phycisphaerales bacterium]
MAGSDVNHHAPNAADAQGGSVAVALSDATGCVTAADQRWLLETAEHAGRELGAAGEVRVRVVADSEMAAAHERYSKVAGTTDVLTFDLSDGPGELDLDILVCLDEAERQGASRGHEPRRELLLYIVHGMLHGLGYDDHDEADYAKMHAAEDRVLAAIGVGATFARAAEGGAA